MQKPISRAFNPDKTRTIHEDQITVPVIKYILFAKVEGTSCHERSTFFPRQRAHKI